MMKEDGSLMGDNDKVDLIGEGLDGVRNDEKRV